jgi:hypothetical protein
MSELKTLNLRDRGFDSACGIITFIMEIVSHRCTESRWCSSGIPVSCPTGNEHGMLTGWVGIIFHCI